jgi:hypothetical protein
MERFWIVDNFDQLSALKAEAPAQPVALFRGIEDQTWDSFLVAIQIDDKAGAPLQQYTLRAAALGGRSAWHSFTPSFNGGDNTPG